MRPLLAPLLAVAASCTVGPDYQRPAVDVPERWRGGEKDTASLADLDWWALFDDPVLRDLIETALRSNFDVRLALERAAEVRARLGFVRAELYPRLDAGAAAGVVRESLTATPLSPLLDDRQYDSYALFGVLTWELDLFGRIRRATEAELARLEAAEEERRAVAVSLVAEVALAYLDIRDLDDRIAIARATVASRRDYVDMAGLRYRGGKTSELDLRQAEAELARTQSVLIELERQLDRRENDLSFLLGRNPGPVPRGRPLQELPVPPRVPPGLPSDLLKRRPDIRAAEQDMVAANAQVGEATALLYPRISLTGQAGWASTEMSTFLESPSGFWQLILNLSAPIWDWGRNRARVGETEARLRQAVILYERSIRQALREVEDALTGYRKAVERLEAAERRTAAQRRVLDLAESRYRGGVAAYLEVLDAQREQFDAELQRAAALRDRLQAVVRLYRALGGGWGSTAPR